MGHCSDLLKPFPPPDSAIATPVINKWLTCHQETRAWTEYVPRSRMEEG